MIDWLKFRIPWKPPKEIGGDRVMVLSVDGEVQWERLRPLEVVGSHDSSLRVSSCPISQRLVVDGNPVKFFQGHNLWGTDDIHGLAQAAVSAVNERAGLDVPSSLIESVGRGVFEISRIDLTEMFSTGSKLRAYNALRAMGDSASMRYGGRGTITQDGTLYFRQHSRRLSVKAYCKGREIQAKGHTLPEDLLYRDKLIDFAEDKLRIEVVIRAMELKRRALENGFVWCNTTARGVYSEVIANLEIPEMTELTGDALETLPPRLRLVHESWRAGTDLRVTLPRRTFYRYRGELLRHGIDIGVPQPKERSNVVRLVNVIRCEPAEVPTWARGTSLYFEPRLIA